MLRPGADVPARAARADPLVRRFDANARFVERLLRRGIDARRADVATAELPRADVVVMQASLYHFLPEPQAAAMVQRMMAAALERVVIAEPVRNLASSRLRPVARLAAGGAAAGAGAQEQRFDADSLRALMAAASPRRSCTPAGARRARARLRPGRRRAMTGERLPFNRPDSTGDEAVGDRRRHRRRLDRRQRGADHARRLSAPGESDRLAARADGNNDIRRTARWKMAALLSQVGPGDEVVMPSFTFVSTANAFVLRGATPVFVDVDPDTLNIDPRRAADAVGDRTRALVAVHYGGIGCDMQALGALAAERGLLLVEDAAQCIGASAGGRALGTFGALGTLSFHETKNVSCGEGGALLVNDERLAARAEILQEKGTDRRRFARGDVDHYGWVDLGSSFLMSEFTAALLAGQLERVAEINAARMAIWDAYHAAFAPLEASGLCAPPRGARGHAPQRAPLPPGARRPRDARQGHRHARERRSISAYFHYVPLHSAPAGLRHGRVHGRMDVTDAAAASLVRLPLWVGMTDADVARVSAAVRRALSA